MAATTTMQLMAPWPEVKEKIKEANVDITDEDLQYYPADEEKLLRHLAEKLNMPAAEVRSWIESIAANKGKAS